MSQGTPLKRSQKTEFNPTTTASMVVQRERSFIKSNRDQQKRRSQTMATIKANNNKPTMELYRPPNVRTDLAPSGPNNKLNVHAKEFTMMSHHELQSSKSSGQLNLQMASFEPSSSSAVPSLQHSKSSGNILRHHHHPIIPILPGGIPILHHQTSQIINLPNYQYFNQPIFSGQNHPSLQQHFQQPTTQQINPHPLFVGQNLKRSKSLGAADAQQQQQQLLAAKLKNLAKDEMMDLTMFENEEHQMNLKQAIDDPNQLPSRILMDLVKIILEKAVEGIRYSESIAKLCVAIIEREKNQTFLESLLNMCQQWYQERDKILRGIKAGDGTRFTAFMWFLTEMCSQLKRHQLKDQFESLQPDLVLLSVLAKCCQACITLPIKCLSETECLFFVLTSIGRDLEMELPQQLEQLLASVRDGFLANTACPSSAVRRTLLQLIELHASNWQLPGSSVLYYYPRIK